MADMKNKEKKEADEPSFENVLEQLGALGKFQIIQVIFCYLSMLLTSSVILSFVFEGYEPPHVCNVVNETQLISQYGLQNDTNVKVIYESCQIKIVSNRSGISEKIDALNCPNGRDFFDAKHTTFLSEWDLVCESSGVAEVSQTFFNIGQMIGAVIGSSLADRLGRRPVFIVSQFLMTVAEWCIIAAPNIFVVYGLKLMSGIFYQAVVCCYFVYAMEYMTPKHREANGCAMCVVWLIGTLVVAAIGYFFRNDGWRYYQGSVGVLGLICLAYPLVLYESPRWLVAAGKTEEALRVLEKASEMNGKDFQKVKETFVAYVNHAFPSKPQSLPMIGNGNQDEPDDVIFNENETKQGRKFNMLDLLRIKSLRKSTLITWYLFVTNILTYYGIYMTSSNVAGNRFLNFTLLNLVEIPSCICGLVMMKKMNRRVVLMVFMGLSAISLMTSMLLDTFAEGLEGSGHASTVLFIIGKFAITASFNVVFIVAPEIFPTKLRSMANGFCCGLARVGGMVAPFMRPLYQIVKWGPGSIFTFMCLVGVLLTLMLPESKDADLPETIEDLGKKNKTGELIKE